MNFIKALLELLKELFAKQEQPGVERPSPGDWVQEEALSYNQTTGVLSIDLKQLTIPLIAPPVVILPGVPDTNSMDPVFDAGNNNILIQGANGPDMEALRNALKVGDVAVYITSNGGYIIHRIIDISVDEHGEKYFVFEGDNNAGIRDAQIVRPENITHISIGTIY